LVSHLQPGPKTLFATHYHELQALAEKFPAKVQNFHMAITEHDKKLVFLYQLMPGGTSQSFGLAVAELAGVPSPVIERAKVLLSEIQNDSHVLLGQEKVSQLASTKANSTDFEQQLAQLNLDELTPLEALNFLARLKQDLG
jgi:DNA mismatch repair protein MutS